MEIKRAKFEKIPQYIVVFLLLIGIFFFEKWAKTQKSYNFHLTFGHCCAIIYSVIKSGGLSR